MNIWIASAVLSEITKEMARAAARGATVRPIEKFVQILADPGASEVTFRVADGKGVGLRMSVTDTSLPENPVEIRGGGGICLPAKELAELVKRLPQSERLWENFVEIEVRKETACIRSGSVNVELNGVSADIFTPFALIGEKPAAKVVFQAPEFRRAVREVAYAADGSGSRPQLQGVHVGFSGGNIVTFEATDSRRAAFAQASVKAESVEASDLLVDAAVLSQIAGMVPADDDEEIRVYGSPMGLHVVWNDGATEWIARALDERFPNLSKVVPQTSHWTAVVDRQALESAVARALVLTRDEQNMEMRLTLGANSVKLTGQSIALGKTSEEIPVDVTADSGQAPQNITFNGRYLLEVLRAYDARLVDISVAGAEMPVTVAPNGSTESRAIFLPLRVLAQQAKPQPGKSA